jgi:hypothetical protein
VRASAKGGEGIERKEELGGCCCWSWMRLEVGGRDEGIVDSCVPAVRRDSDDTPATKELMVDLMHDASLPLVRPVLSFQ